MRATYRVLAYLLALEVVVQAAAIAWAVFGLSTWIEDGGVLDKAGMESEGTAFDGVHRVRDPRHQRPDDRPGDRADPVRGVVLRAVPGSGRVGGGRARHGDRPGGTGDSSRTRCPPLGMLHGAVALVLLVVALIAALEGVGPVGNSRGAARRVHRCARRGLSRGGAGGRSCSGRKAPARRVGCHRPHPLPPPVRPPRRHRRTLVAILAALVVLAPVAWLWASSLPSGTWSVTDMGYPDDGGGPPLSDHAGMAGMTGRSGRHPAPARRAGRRRRHPRRPRADRAARGRAGRHRLHAQRRHARTGDPRRGEPGWSASGWSTPTCRAG